MDQTSKRGNMQAKLVRTFKLTVKDKEQKQYRLLTAGERSDYYVDYYILQRREEDELGAERWETELKVKVSDSDLEPITLLMFRILHGEGVTSTVPEKQLPASEKQGFPPLATAAQMEIQVTKALAL
jgi:hypothetical protein